MNNLKTIVVVGLLAFSCAQKDNQKNVNSKTTNEKMIVGGGADAHGCVSTAGYTWSVTKKKCVRVWEDKDLELLPTDTKETSFTAVMFSAQKDTAEIFIPTQSQSILLKAAGKDTWSASGFELKTSVSGATLTKDSKVLYQSK